jgi:hypothetical protein
MTEITKKSEEQKGAEAEVESFRKNLGPFVVAAETEEAIQMRGAGRNTHAPTLLLIEGLGSELINFAAVAKQS